MKIMRRVAIPATLLLTTAALLTGSAAVADGVGIIPTTVIVDQNHRIATVTVANHDATTTFQVTGYAWSQADGADKLAPTTDLLISPPVFTLLPQGQQTIRLALRNPAPVAGELAYRISLRNTPTEAAAPGSAIRLKVQYSLPVFIASPQGAQPQLSCAFRTPPGRVELLIANGGLAHAHITHVQLRDANGTLVDQASARYVLAGANAQLTFAVKGHVVARSLEGQLQFDQGLPPQQFVATRDP
jgi:fimbrial chaperone protein